MDDAWMMHISLMKLKFCLGRTNKAILGVGFVRNTQPFMFASTHQRILLIYCSIYRQRACRGFFCDTSSTRHLAIKEQAKCRASSQQLVTAVLCGAQLLPAFANEEKGCLAGWRWRMHSGSFGGRLSWRKCCSPSWLLAPYQDLLGFTSSLLRFFKLSPFRMTLSRGPALMTNTFLRTCMISTNFAVWFKICLLEHKRARKQHLIIQ